MTQTWKQSHCHTKVMEHAWNTIKSKHGTNEEQNKCVHRNFVDPILKNNVIKIYNTETSSYTYVPQAACGTDGTSGGELVEVEVAIHPLLLKITNTNTWVRSFIDTTKRGKPYHKTIAIIIWSRRFKVQKKLRATLPQYWPQLPQPAA